MFLLNVYLNIVFSFFSGFNMDFRKICGLLLLLFIGFDNKIWLCGMNKGRFLFVNVLIDVGRFFFG